MRFPKRLLAWWYVCIALGFVLLGIRNLLVGAPAWTVALRWAIAAGFLVLGLSTLRSGRLLAVLLAIGLARAQSPPDARDIIRRSVERDLLNFERLKNYTYQERDEERNYDTKGHLKKTEIETYDILILGGRDYERLVARDDKPLSEKDARKEQEKMDKELARRQNESPAEKAKAEKERKQQREFLNEIPDAFDFKLVAEEPVSGKPAWVISAEPKPSYRAKQRLAKVITKMRARIWIDKGEFQWVKVEAQAADAISFGLGLFKIEPGGVVRFEQIRINDEVWLPASAAIRADARLAIFKRVHAEVDMKFSGYKKFQSESQFRPELSSPF